jgi:hypothetical protein
MCSLRALGVELGYLDILERQGTAGGAAQINAVDAPATRPAFGAVLLVQARLPFR